MVAGVAIVAAIYWNRTVTVDELELEGNYYTESEVIRKTADVPFGIKPDSLDLDILSSRVEQLNYVRSVSPYIEPNGDLTLTIRERQPVALLVNGSDRMYVDAEGVKLNVIPGKQPDVPLLYGFSAVSLRDTLRSEDFNQIRNFLLEARRNAFGWTTISEVVFDPADGVVALSHENGVKLLFGRNEFRTKLENWKAFYTDVIKVKGIGTMQQVDLRFSNQVVTRES